MAQELCLACYGPNLSVVNGVLVCDDCGTQCLAQVEETEYDEVGGGNISRHRAAGSSKSLPRGFVPKKELTPDEARSTIKMQGRVYLQCLQLLLQAQADALVTTFHVIPEVRPLIRHIWLSLLPHLRCLDFDFNEGPGADTQQDMEGSDGDDGDGDQAGTKRGRTDFLIGGKFYRQDNALRYRKQRLERQRGISQEKLDEKLLKSVPKITPIVNAFAMDITLSTTLAICILACIILRQPVSPFDILRWALDGQLPFLDAQDRCSHILESMEPGTTTPLHVLLHQDGTGPATNLLTSAVELSSMLGLQLPNVNGPLLLYKACCELALPEEVFLVAKELHDLLLQDSPLLSPLSMNANHHPYCLLISLTATAAWLCYGLDGKEQNAVHFAGLPPPPQPPRAHAHAGGSPDHVLDCDQGRSGGPGQGGAGSEEGRGVQGLNAGVAGDGVQGGEAGVTGGVHAGEAVEMQGGVAECLPPSRAAMMQRQQQQQQQQEGLSKQSSRAAARAIGAQDAIEAEVAARTGSIQASGWLAWAQARMLEHARPHSYPMTVEEACRLRGAGLASYLQYCREVVFAGTQVPSYLSDVASFLEQLAGEGQVREGPAVENDGVDVVGQEEGQGEGLQQQQQPQLEHTGALHSYPHIYTNIPSKLQTYEAHHPDVLALAAGCSVLVNVHPDLVLKQMTLLQKTLSNMEAQCWT